jgi:hypothetical protein
MAAAYERNVKVEGTWLALSTAAFDGQVETAKKLINKGADLDLAIYELKEIASKQSPYLSYPDNRKVYDKANLGVEMLNRLTPKQVEPKTIIAPGTASASVLEKPIIKSDVDELPAIKAKPNKNSHAIIIGIENYRQKLPTADFATQDAKLVADYLIKVMGYPEENPDGSIAISDLFSYIKPQVERIARRQYNNEQTPQLIGAKKN